MEVLLVKTDAAILDVEETQWLVVSIQGGIIFLARTGDCPVVIVFEKGRFYGE